MNNSNNLSVISDSPEEIDNDVWASIDFKSSLSFLLPPLLRHSLVSNYQTCSVLTGLSIFTAFN
ncbi:hypothetical protein MTR_3g006600 [Medicago truncatula]|uniref:Uncharacterized protein n=1 Tax=Medicago truncatula TaxID=3880 RepID=A0A072UUS7_MEDTR|nr:hypothetical protein MTR_3g006600 [Medicago truncatula]